MDCEKFETALMDELYGELDELTSAAAKRHVSGCARCAALIGGLRATRRVATLPRVEPPEGLEQRILAAAAA
ncbi:MAG TPA: zf-HC2 domain-containing protein, partial [Polyangiaceae bacterium]|nr:zf-HC2 domain-containing protein [Polyangiaceae bacterium]